MASPDNKRLSELSSAILPLHSTDLLYLVQTTVTQSSSTSVKITFADFVAEMPTGSGVTSLSKSGDTPLTGDVTLSGGSNVTLTQTGQDISIAASGGGGGGSAESPYEFDDFIINTATGNLFKFSYVTGENPSPITPVADHPGIVRLSTSTGNSLNAQNTLGSMFLPADTFTLVFVVRPNGHADADYLAGARDQLSATPNNGIYIEGLSSDTNWFLVTRSGGTQTRIDTGIAISNSTWFKFSVYRKDASTIGAVVNGGSEVTSTTNVPTATLGLFLGITTHSGTQTMDIDFWSFADSVTRF